MKKKVVVTVIALLLIVIVYNAMLPILAKPKPLIDDPKLANAILDFAGQQMHAKDFKLPSDLQNWKAETIELIKIEDLPGSQGFRKATVNIKGSYLAAGEKDTTKQTPFYAKHLRFKIGKKYPEGISVQFLRMDL